VTPQSDLARALAEVLIRIAMSQVVQREGKSRALR